MTTAQKPSTVTGGYKVTVDPRELGGIRTVTFQNQDERSCTLATTGGPLTLSFFAPGVVRLTLGDTEYPDYGLLVQEPQPVEVDVQNTSDAVTLTCGEDTVSVTFEPFHLKLSRNGQTRLESSRELHMGGGPRMPLLVREEKSGQDWSGLSLELRPGEPIYGLGEKFGRLNKRGERVVSWNEDAYGVNGEYAYKNVPFAWSPHGWGMLAHTPTRVVHGVGYSDWSHRSYCLLSQEKKLDVFFFLGDTPAELLSHYASSPGPRPKCRDGVWASGCRGPFTAPLTKPCRWPASCAQGGCPATCSRWTAAPGWTWTPAARSTLIRATPTLPPGLPNSRPCITSCASGNTR